MENKGETLGFQWRVTGPAVLSAGHMMATGGDDEMGPGLATLVRPTSRWPRPGSSKVPGDPRVPLGRGRLCYRLQKRKERR